MWFPTLRHLHYTVTPRAQGNHTSCVGHRHFCSRTHTRECYRRGRSLLLPSDVSNSVLSSFQSRIFGWTVKLNFVSVTVDRGDPRSNISVTSGRPDTLFCVSDNPTKLSYIQVSHRVVLGQTFSGAFGEFKTTNVGVRPTHQII